MFAIRKAQAEDMKEIYENSNEPEVRRISLSSETIKWEEHVKWFENIIKDPDTYFYVVYDRDIFIGQVRFKVEDKSSVIVSISLGKNGRGKGYSFDILKRASEIMKKENDKIESIIAYILPENTASIGLFEKSGYCKIGEGIIKGKMVYKYIKN